MQHNHTETTDGVVIATAYVDNEKLVHAYEEHGVEGAATAYRDMVEATRVERARESRRKWYHSNKKHARKMIRNRVVEISEWFMNFKSTLKCEGENCPYPNHPAILTFHHLDPKEKEIDLAHAAHNGWSKKRIMKEVSKCKVLCRNCHAILHWNERQQ